MGGCGSGERINGLVRIADDRQVVAIAEPGVEHPLLQRCDVLVFIDDEAAVAVAELARDGGVVLDRGGRVQQQIVEVQQRGAVATRLHCLVAGVDGRHLRGVERNVTSRRGDRCRVTLRADQRCLRPLDLPGEIPDVVGACRYRGPVRGLRHDAELAVEKFPRRVTDHAGPEVLQLPAGRRVERHRLDRAGAHPLGAPLVERTQPAPHLACGARGERHRKHLRWCDVARRHQIGDTPGDRSRLARARACEHAHGPARRLHRLALLIVEIARQTIERPTRQSFDGLRGGGRGSPGWHGVHLGRAQRQRSSGVARCGSPPLPWVVQYRWCPLR
jgi:hypothetical protein